MILNWDDFNNWRETSLQYHKMLGEHNYTNALTFFEYARQYFNAKGFPPAEKKTKTGRKGKYTQKDSKEQLKHLGYAERFNYNDLLAVVNSLPKNIILNEERLYQDLFKQKQR